MSEPLVVAIMLTAGREKLAQRAVQCFRNQTYPNKSMVIVNSGACPTLTIGELRNCGAQTAAQTAIQHPAEVLIHWDDDDWSNPYRIAEQVELLQATGAAAVGYNEALFWREEAKWDGTIEGLPPIHGGGEAWVFNGPTILGTSLCYRAEVAAAHPFPNTSYGEDTTWLRTITAAGHKVEAVTGLMKHGREPSMIARIHAGNTSKAYSPQAMREAPQHWRRAPEWDEAARKVMEG